MIDDNQVPAIAGQSNIDTTQTVIIAVNPSNGGVVIQLV